MGDGPERRACLLRQASHLPGRADVARLSPAANGPEEFSLKLAKPGKYRIQANFYGHRQQIVAGATTLQAKLQTRFGTAEVEERIVTLRLQSRGGVVMVGEFEVAETE